MLIWDKIQRIERNVPAPVALGMIANQLATSLEKGTAPVPIRQPTRHVDDGLVPIRLSNGDIVRMKPLAAARVVKNGVACYMEETDGERG